MTDEMQVGIVRDQTPIEKSDFIQLKETSKDPEASVRADNVQRFSKRNRSILLKSKDSEELLKSIKSLSCKGCFDDEHRKSIASDDFEEAFSKYKGRMKLKSVQKHYHKNGLQYEKAISIWFERCRYCGKTEIIGFSSDEMSEELHKSLYQLASKEDGEV